MVLSKEDFLSRLKNKIGDDTSDDALSFIEDMTDTFNDLETKSAGNNDSEWQKKYDELDKSWRQKYKERFYSSETDGEEVKEEQKEDVKEDGEATTFEDLFVERED